MNLVGGRSGRLVIVLAGIILGQAVLYGPSLAGRKVLLPLDILAEPAFYLPQTPEVTRVEAQNRTRLDLILLCEPARRFGVSELEAGRLPIWAPYHYAGVPFIWPKFSPFLGLQFLARSPVVLAWTQLLAAIVGGVGAYVFFRRALAVGFWPATICAWCYPLTAFFVLWQGFPTGLAVYWLPWLLWAVDRTVRGRGSLATMGLSVVTGLALVSGHLDMAGQTLLASGLYALWAWGEACGKEWFQRQGRKAIALLVVGWGLGFLLAAPYILPVLEHTRTGARMAERSAGREERPPVGLAALPQAVLPFMYGSSQADSLRVLSDNEAETSTATYTGVLATLLVAPLAWCSRRHRGLNLFWAFLILFGLSWCLNLPGFVALLRLPGLNMLSHNRMVFATSFAVLAMAAVGLELLRRGPLLWRGWFWLPAGVLAGLAGWCGYRAIQLPEPMATQLAAAIGRGAPLMEVHDLGTVERIQAWYVRHYSAAALLCGLAAGGWLLLRLRPAWQPRLVPLLAALLAGDLLWFAWGRSSQCDPGLYFPTLPALEAVSKAAPGRVIGYRCLPASVGALCGLRDVRGYDSVDPGRLIELEVLGAEPESPAPVYALIQWLIPKVEITSNGTARLSPVFDLLGVRYVVFRGSPPPNARPAFQSTDYWVLENPHALPRLFVPRRVETVAEAAARLQKLATPDFNPQEVAYVEIPVSLPEGCRGSATILEEIPTRIVASVRMETAGLMVLADLWDQGWQAYLDGKRVPILRANHAVRGVVVPAGSATLEFRYAPASLTWGLRLCGLAVAVLLAWWGVGLRGGRPRKGPGATDSAG